MDIFTGNKRMKLAMNNKKPDRVPVMPQICHGHAINIFYKDFRKGTSDIINNPEKALELIIKTGKYYGVDGIRLFLPAVKREAVDDGKNMIARDIETGEIIGKVDVDGGGGIILNEKEFTIKSIEDLKSIPVVECGNLLETDSFCILKEKVEQAKKDYNFFVASAPPGFTVNYLSYIRGKSMALMDLIEKPELVNAIMDKALAISIEHAKALIKCGVDALYIGDPIASASVISPSTFKKFCFPRFKAFCDYFKNYDILTYLHICGNCTPLLDMMADTGVNCIEPLDPLGGVKIEEVKKRVGNRVSLMGGVNILTLLNKNPDLVYEESINCCEKAGKNGGYILAAGDMVPDFSPEENIKAMIKAAKDFRYN